jgi:hypothetical protein
MRGRFFFAGKIFPSPSLNVLIKELPTVDELVEKTGPPMSRNAEGPMV